jgi:hypothetical protein
MNEYDSELAHSGHGINTSKSHLQPRQFDKSPWTGCCRASGGDADLRD